MIISEHEQGTDEWMQERIGIPTASNFDKIFTTTLKPSSTSKTYLNTLLAEWMLGEKEQIKQSEWMQRGIELEAEAREAFGFVTDYRVDQVGLCYRDEQKLVGASPDGFVFETDIADFDSLLEIKCPKASTHVGWMLSGGLPSTYFQQCHGQLYVCDLDSLHFVSYYPGLPLFHVVVERDEKIDSAIHKHISEFIEKMLEGREKLEGMK